MKIKRVEQGWAGHFCGAPKCSFRRNTMLVADNYIRIIVSTVGNYRTDNKPAETIGLNRYYETMVWRAYKDSGYWEINQAEGDISFDSKWAIDNVERGSDNEANDMHEAIVNEIELKILNGTLPKDTQ